jgi:putative ABC transport system permease protein
MFKLNLKIALRNLIKNKVYAAINIGGLAIGLTAFVFVLLYINYEESYDQWSPDLNHIYQVRERHGFFTSDNKDHWQEVGNSKVAAELRAKIPQAVAVTKVDQNWSFSDGSAVKIDHQDPVLVKYLRDADSSFFKVFPYKFLQGDEKQALIVPKSIVLKESLANQLFGTTKVLGKQLRVLRWQGDEGTLLTITGVVTTPSTPESVNFSAISRSGNKDQDPPPSSTNYCQIYVRLNGSTDTIALNKSVQKIYIDFKKRNLAEQKIDFKEYYKGKNEILGLKLVSLQTVHSNPALTINWKEKLKPIIGISIFLLLVSIINFTNLAAAQSVQRAKEVGVRKVLGAYKKKLLIQFMVEAALQSVLSLFLTIVLIEILLPSFNQQFNVELSFWHQTHLFIVISELLGLFVFVTLLAGFYPAWILSNYKPISVLKGNYETGLKGVGLRNALIVFQFIISVTFIIAIGVMQLQTRYIATKDLGFDKNRLINIKSDYNESFASRLKRIPGVQYVATTTQVMGNAFNFNNTINYKGNKIDINGVTVSMEALPALGIKIVEGRIFSPQYAADTVNTVVLNETAAKLIKKHPIGEQFKYDGGTVSFQIVGVIKDYHNEGFDKAVLPTVYKVSRIGASSSTNNLLVRFSSENNAEIIKKIQAEWKSVYPNFPMQYSTMQDSFDTLLADNNRFMNMILLFSIISVLLSLLGLFALSTFLAKRRTKEIAIRKILGASNFQLINMLNRSFLILVITANVISWPIAFILTKKWLEGFAYRIDMPFWPYLIATLTSIIVALFTVSLQARKAAVNNPVNALKYE